MSLILQAPDRRSRIDILLRHREEIIEDCWSALGEAREDFLKAPCHFASKALRAFEAGHLEAAQAMAVVTTESVAAGYLGRRYNSARESARFDPKEVAVRHLLIRAALAPIHSFYQEWYPNSAVLPPEALNRHMSVHHPTLAQYSVENSTLAVMLAVSVACSLRLPGATS